MWNTLHLGVQQSFAVIHSHYENINLEAMGEGFAPSYEDAELDEIMKMAATPAQNLSDKIEDEVVPRRG
jgi:hypothetical protein